MPAQVDAPPARRLAGYAGLLLLALWGAEWGLSLQQNRLVGGRFTWVPAWEFLGLDFLNPCLASRHWLAGGDPYREPFGDPREGTRFVGKFCYPPITLPLFSWCALVTPPAAVVIWVGVLAALAVCGAFLAWRARRRLGLSELPLPFVVGAFLCSTPVFFSLERGNIDLLLVLPLAGAACALQRRSLPRDLLAGGCLALAAWVKLYPGLLALSLPALGRWRALACFVGAAVLIGLPGVDDLPAFRANLGEAVVSDAPSAAYHPCHTLSCCWEYFWAGTPLAWLGRVPGPLAAAALVLTLALTVSWQVFRCPDSRRILFPYLLWLAALATFVPRISNDYNFYYLPLAALAVWDRRDPAAVHAGLALLLLWWQPWALPIGGREFFACKVLGFLAVTGCLVRRIRAQRPGVACEAERDPAPLFPGNSVPLLVK
jgi:hypothetical protein